MAGWYPKAVVRNIPPGANDPPIKPRAVVLHVDAGNAHSLYDYFRFRSGGIESHFHVRKDGVVEQYRNIYWEADANHKANDFAVSIETQGYGHGKWNQKQLKAIKELILWLNKEAGIPLRKIQNWNGSGIGYHIQFGSPGHWTPVAKACPGPERIHQFNNNIVPWIDRQNKKQTKQGGNKGTRVKSARKLLVEARKVANRKGNKRRFNRIRKALQALPKK